MDAVPVQAKPHLVVLAAEAKRLRAPIPTHILAGQIDKETNCPNKRQCWNTETQFKTSREWGYGLAQFTKTQRFDALTETRAKHLAELGGWSWKNPGEARYQLRALVLKTRDNWQVIAPLFDDPLYAVVTAWNRGIGGVRADRRICQVTAGCNASKWAGNVATACSSGSAIIPGTRRTACQIKNSYAPDVAIRAQKYKGRV